MQRGGAFIKRMWSAKVFDNICAEDVGLNIWHLPAEKECGFVKLFDFLQNEDEKGTYLDYVEELLAVRKGKKGKRIRKNMKKSRGNFKGWVFKMIQKKILR